MAKSEHTNIYLHGLGNESRNKINIFESLKSHIKAGKIVTFEVSGRYFSHMTIAIWDNDDETLNIKIHTSGG